MNPYLIYIRNQIIRLIIWSRCLLPFFVLQYGFSDEYLWILVLSSWTIHAKISNSESENKLVLNHVKLWVFSKGTVLCDGCWLWAWQILGVIADLLWRKVESTKWLKHKLCHVRKPIVWTNQWQIWVSFSFEVAWGTAGICHTGIWGFP